MEELADALPVSGAPYTYMYAFPLPLTCISCLMK